jgi:hypothetical protein
MKINLSVAMSWRKTLQERHDELVGLRNQNSTQETRFFGANADKERVIKPRYDVVALDNSITKVAREVRKLDEAIKATNMATTVLDYERDDAVLGELVPAKE